MAEHSKLPWRYDNDEISTEIVGADGGTVADLYPVRGVVRDANAAFIVKACNAHEANEAKIEALVRALQDIRQRANESGTGEMGLLDTIHDIDFRASTALQQAGEK